MLGVCWLHSDASRIFEKNPNAVKNYGIWLRSAPVGMLGASFQLPKSAAPKSVAALDDSTFEFTFPDRYRSRTDQHNMYKEYRDLTINGAVPAAAT